MEKWGLEDGEWENKLEERMWLWKSSGSCRNPVPPWLNNTALDYSWAKNKQKSLINIIFANT